jgi:hypothetical protein
MMTQPPLLEHDGGIDRVTSSAKTSGSSSKNESLRISDDSHKDPQRTE